MKSEQIPRRRCGKMDVRKDQSHLTLNQTPEAHVEKSHAPGKDRVGLLGDAAFLFLFSFFSCLGTG